MPFIKLYTTLSKDKLPERFMPQLVEKLSVIVSKDKKWFNWILETDKCMSKVKFIINIRSPGHINTTILCVLNNFNFLFFLHS